MDSKKKKLPLGIENFEDLIRNDFYYIDKTGLIRDILKQPAKVTGNRAAFCLREQTETIWKVSEYEYVGKVFFTGK